MSKYLNRDAILNAKDFKTEEVEVPEWGGTVLVKGLNGTERDKYEGSLYKQVGNKMVMEKENIRAKLVALSIVDEEGKTLFTTGDVQALGAKSAAALDRVFGVAQKLSKITDNDIEDLAKNSEDAQDTSTTN